MTPQLMRWTNGGLAGLVRRRRAEGTLFDKGTYGEAAKADAVTEAKMVPAGEDPEES